MHWGVPAQSHLGYWLFSTETPLARCALQTHTQARARCVLASTHSHLGDTIDHLLDQFDLREAEALCAKKKSARKRKCVRMFVEVYGSMSRMRVFRSEGRSGPRKQETPARRPGSEQQQHQ